MFGRKKIKGGETYGNLRQTAVNAIEGGDVKRAIQYYRRAAELEPDQPEAHDALCAMLLPMMQIDDAIYHGQEVIRLGAATDYTYLNLAIAFGNKCQLEEAVKFARKALKNSSDDYVTDTANQLIQDIGDGTYIGGPWLRKLDLSKYKNMIGRPIYDDDGI